MDKDIQDIVNNTSREGRNRRQFPGPNERSDPEWIAQDSSHIRLEKS
jgi:hypothetical protein